MKNKERPVVVYFENVTSNQSLQDSQERDG